MNFNFAFFYNVVVKNNTTRKQYDALYILLLGDTRDEYNQEHQFQEGFIEISDSARTNYITGKDKIRQEILTLMLDASIQEYARRLRLLYLPNVKNTVWGLKAAISELSSSTELKDMPLRSEEDCYLFLAHAFQKSLQCPVSNKLSNETQKYLQTFHETEAPEISMEESLFHHASGELHAYLGSLTYEEYVLFQQNMAASGEYICDQYHPSVNPLAKPSIDKIPYWKFCGSFSAIQMLIYEHLIFEKLPCADIYLDLPNIEEVCLEMSNTMRMLIHKRELPYTIRAFDILDIEVTIFLYPMIGIS